MREYVEKVLGEMPDEMDRTATTPAASHLFQMRSDAIILENKKREFLHTTVAKLLFLCKRGQPDIQTAVAFLCTRVREPTSDDENKLTRVIRYLRGTKDLTLRLRADNPNIVKWWVDGAFAVHEGMKSHTGGVMSLGKGSAYSASRKKNTKSSTEAELVAIDNVLPQALWTKYFLEGQGYGMNTILYEDNQSTTKLAQNGKLSSRQRTRHINIMYFFITNRIARNEVAIQYCPTKNTVADYFTKPLQGALFYKFCDQIMGVVEMETILGIDPINHRSVLESDHSNNVNDGNKLTYKRRRK